MPIEEKYFSIKSLDDLMRCINLASLLEIAGWPKPGNVHRTKNFKNTRFEHFLAGISAIQPNFRDFCEKAYEFSENMEGDYGFLGLGSFFKETVEQMMEWQKGGNVVLGHILIIAPLAAASAICLKIGKTDLKAFKYIVKKIIHDTTVQDTVDLYEAFKMSSPGGLGKVDKYDINDETSIKQIQTDEITLKKIFDFSKDYDSISSEYANGFDIILNKGLPYYTKVFSQTRDINITTVNTFLKILSDYPDTLIVRKSGKEASLMVSQKAKEIVEKGGISTEKGLILTQELDNYLQERQGLMNPGTTADIIAGIIFCALIFGLKF